MDTYTHRLCIIILTTFYHTTGDVVKVIYGNKHCSQEKYLLHYWLIMQYYLYNPDNHYNIDYRL